MAQKRDTTGWLRMGELSERSGVPSSTIKHYLREELLPAGLVAVNRNSALYDVALVERIQHIKDLQQTHFLPLWRIKEVMAGRADAVTSTVAAAAERALDADGTTTSVAVLRARGLEDDELRFLVERGLVPDDDALSGDALALVETVLRARSAGLTTHLSTVDVLGRYLDRVTALVEEEVAIFQRAIVANHAALATSTVDAMSVSERLVRLIRRRLLLPVFETQVQKSAKKKSPTTTKTKKTATKKTPTKKTPTKKTPAKKTRRG